MDRLLSITEYHYFYIAKSENDGYINNNGNIALPKKVFEMIQNACVNFECFSFSYKKNIGEIIQCQNYVGVIMFENGLTIEILPKIFHESEQEVEKARDVVVKMLRAQKKFNLKEYSNANLATSKLPIFEVFIAQFLKELTYLVQRGIKSDYIEQKENLKFLKGRLDVKKQLEKNSVHKERFYVSFDEFSIQRVENKLIKSTLEVVKKLSKSKRNLSRIQDFHFVFDEVEKSVDVVQDFKRVKTSRMMKDYEEVLNWCKLFLLGNGLSLYAGKQKAVSILFDMNQLFEEYVGYELKKHSKKFQIKQTLGSQNSGTHLLYDNDNKGRFSLNPDIFLKINDKDIIPMDTKWKVIETFEYSGDTKKKSLSQADLYQLFAYGKKWKSEKVILIYPYHDNLHKEYEEKSKLYHYEKEEKFLKLFVVFWDVFGKGEIEVEKFYKKIEMP